MDHLYYPAICIDIICKVTHLLQAKVAIFAVSAMWVEYLWQLAEETYRAVVITIEIEDCTYTTMFRADCTYGA